MKRNLIHGAIAGLLSGFTSVAYMNSYSNNMEVDFSATAAPIMIIITSIIGVVIAAVGHWGLHKFNWLGSKTDITFNLIFFFLSFISIFGTFGASLPEGTLKPELFPGMIIPMHFFPILFWLIVKPMFNEKQ